MPVITYKVIEWRNIIRRIPIKALARNGGRKYKDSPHKAVLDDDVFQKVYEHIKEKPAEEVVVIELTDSEYSEIEPIERFINERRNV